MGKEKISSYFSKVIEKYYDNNNENRKITSLQMICKPKGNRNDDYYINNFKEKKEEIKMYNFFSRKVNKKHQGFTLIELLVVIAIIAILIAIAVIGYQNATKKATNAAHNANVRTIESACVVYGVENDPKTCTMELLVKGGYLQEEPLVPNGIKGRPTDGKYKITYAENKYKVEPEKVEPEKITTTP